MDSAPESCVLYVRLNGLHVIKYASAKQRPTRISCGQRYTLWTINMEMSHLKKLYFPAGLTTFSIKKQLITRTRIVGKF